MSLESRRQWLALVVLSLGFFMTMLDLSIVNIALPDMISELHASLAEILWVINAYVLVIVVVLITAGRLGDLYGARRLFVAGTLVFGACSLLCGLAQSPGQLIAARALQGLGAALLLPQTMSMIVTIFSAERRGSALGVWGAVGGVAAISGPTLGGLLVDTVGWRWIFLVNVPVAALVLVLTPILVPDVRHGRQHRLDLVGVLFSLATLSTLTFAVMEGQRYSWNGWIISLLVLSCLCGAAFVVQQKRRQESEPLVPFALFRSRDYLAMNLVAAAISVSIVSLMILLAVYFQSVLGFSALKAGLAIAPASLMSTIFAPISGRLSDRFDGKRMLLFGLLLSALGMLWLAFLMDPGATWASFVLPMAIIGIGNGFLIAPSVTVAMRGIAPPLAGAASGVLNTTRQLGSVLAVALVGVLMQVWLPVTNIQKSDYMKAVDGTIALPVVVIMLGAAICGAVLLAGRKQEVRVG